MKKKCARAITEGLKQALEADYTENLKTGAVTDLR